MARIANEVRDAILAKIEPVKEPVVTEETTEVEKVVKIKSKKANKK